MLTSCSLALQFRRFFGRAGSAVSVFLIAVGAGARVHRGFDGVFSRRRSASLRFGLSRLGLAAALACFIPPASAAESEPAQDEGIIRHYGSYWRIPVHQGAIAHPIELDMLVYYYDASWGLLWGEVRGRPGFLPCTETPFAIRAGQRVKFKGLVVPEKGLSARTVEATVLEENVPMPAVAVTPQTINPSSIDVRMVEIEGLTGRAAQSDARHVSWPLRFGNSAVTARLLLQEGESPPNLEGKRARMRGLYVIKGDIADLWISSAAQIEALPELAPAAGSAGAGTAPTIRNLAEFWDTPMEKHGVPLPASLELLVYYYDPSWGLLWAESAGEPAFIECHGSPLPIKEGQRVRLDGHVVPGKGIIGDQVKVTLVEPSVKIPAQPVAGFIGDGKRFDRHMVFVQGLVDRQSQADSQHRVWELVSEGYAVTVRTHSSRTAEFPELEGKLVRMRGVYSPKMDPSGELFGIDLWISSPEDVEVVGDLDSDPRFEREVTPIEQVAKAQGLIRVVGTLREYEPGVRAVIRDNTGHIELSLLQHQPYRIGERIEAVGFPLVKGLRRLLGGAVARPFRATDEASLQLTRDGRELKSSDRVHELPADVAALAHPVEITGLVTWSHPSARFLYMEDESGGVLVKFPDFAGKPPAPGNAIRVRGVSASGPYAPYVARPTFESLGAMILPPPPLVSLEQALTGNLEAEWVEMRGYVRSIEQEGLWNRITLTAPNGEFVARMPSDVEVPEILGSIVRVRGVCEGVANDRRQLTGIQLWVIEPSFVRVEASPPADTFAVPRQSIASLRQFSALPALNRWIRVQGTVLHAMGEQAVFIEEEGEALLVSSRQGEPLVPGDVIEAVGLASLEGRRSVLREALYRKVSQEAPPAPVAVERLKPFREELDSRLVTLTATLVSVLSQPNELLIAVENQGAVFNAVLGHSRNATTDHWIPGTELQLTGIYRIDYDQRSTPHAVRLQLRSTDDVKIVRAAPWWTVGRTLGVIAFLVGGAGLGLIWALSLRRRVQRQTDLIRGQFAKEANLEARNRSIVENASDFIFTADLNGNVTAFNPAGERITGYTREEAMGMNLRDLIASNVDGAQARESLRPELGGGATFQTRLKTKDGRGIWVEISSRFVTENGRPSAVLGIVRDISERKEFESSLETARDAAEASARAKSAFLANMSHEIRTPMNGVIGVANLLLDTSLTTEQRDFAETIRMSAESLLTVLNDILDFSKIEAGKLDFENVPFDLTETVESAVDLLAARGAAKNLEISVFVPPEIPQRLIGDPGRLRQVLLNLVGNAIKFTESGEVAVQVQAVDDGAENITLRFEVADTGIGLTDEERERLFQPFSQADSSTTRRFGGTGLGLAICRQIAELMQGGIGVQSTKGQGSTFWFTAQLKKQAPPAEPSAAAAPHPLNARRALLVGPSASVSKLLTHYLAAAGMDVEVCLDAQAAPGTLAGATAAKRPFAFVILASPPPDLAAWSAELQRLPAEERPKVVALTAVDRRLAQEDHQAAGIDATLLKPVRRDELTRTLRRLLSGAPSTGTAPATTAATAQALHGGEGAARALVVEDNVVNQRVSRVVLERMGFRVELAGNGLEALEAIERTRYDFVLMDCQMPEMDGYEATRRIRAGRHADLTIIAMTANAMEGDRERCLKAGMDDYVSKPMRVEELRAALERAQLISR